MKHRVAVVIVHYRTPRLLMDCVESLKPELDPQRDVIVVVDNASPDGSAAQLRDVSGIKLIESQKNLGFAGGNNIGIQSVEADYYMLLNPDTVVRPGAVSTLLAFLDKNPQAAMVGPLLESLDGKPQLSTFGYHTPLGELLIGANIGVVTRLFKSAVVYGQIPQHSCRVEWLAGACLLIRNEVIRRVGLLDARFFMYYEEVDFCRRARKLGFDCWYEPAARVAHLEGQASGIASGQARKRLPRYWFESRHRYYRKHFGYLGVMAADVLWMIGHTMDTVRKWVSGISHSNVAVSETRDFIRYESEFLSRGMPAPAHLQSSS